MRQRTSEKKLLQIWVDGESGRESRLEERDYYVEEEELETGAIVSSSSSTYVLDSKTPRVHQLPIRQLGDSGYEPHPHNSSSTQTYHSQPEPLNTVYIRHDSPIQVTTGTNMPSNTVRVYSNISLGLRLFILVRHHNVKVYLILVTRRNFYDFNYDGPRSLFLAYN